MRQGFAAMLVASLLVTSNATAQEVAITRHDAMVTAVDSNLSLLVDKMEQELAKHRADEARRPYTPVVFASPAYVASRQAIRTSESEDATILSQAQIDADAGVRWDNRWGTSLALRASTTPWYSDFAPTPLTSIEASASQSLLRGGFRHGTRLDSVDLGIELQRALFRAQVEELIRRVDAAYWQLAFAQADVESKVKARDRARSQFDDTTENIRRGLLAPGDIFVVEENLVIFEEQLLRAREDLKLAQLALANLMQLEEPTAQLVASDPVEPDPKLPTTQQALATAINESPQVAAQRVWWYVRLAPTSRTIAIARVQSSTCLDRSDSMGSTTISGRHGATPSAVRTPASGSVCTSRFRWSVGRIELVSSAPNSSTSASNAASLGSSRISETKCAAFWSNWNHVSLLWTSPSAASSSPKTSSRRSKTNTSAAWPPSPTLFASSATWTPLRSPNDALASRSSPFARSLRHCRGRWRGMWESRWNEASDSVPAYRHDHPDRVEVGVAVEVVGVAKVDARGDRAVDEELVPGFGFHGDARLTVAVSLTTAALRVE